VKSMFTGIVKGGFSVVGVERLRDFIRLSVELNDGLTEGLVHGCSVAVNGVCLTVVGIHRKVVFFDVMKETLRVTNLGDLSEGAGVNIERAARFGDDIGGHLLSGHIHDTVVVSKVLKEVNSVTVVIKVNNVWSDYLLPKGYVALNGASLTIGEKVAYDSFRVHLIPETLRRTTFADVKGGSRLNLEIDSQTQVIVNTVKAHMPFAIKGVSQRKMSEVP